MNVPSFIWNCIQHSEWFTMVIFHFYDYNDARASRSKCVNRLRLHLYKTDISRITVCHPHFPNDSTVVERNIFRFVSKCRNLLQHLLRSTNNIRFGIYVSSPKVQIYCSKNRIFRATMLRIEPGY